MPGRFRPLAAVLILAAGVCLASTLDPQMREVERLRGLTFTRGVAQRTIDRSELRALLHKELAGSIPYSLQDYAEILAALQLVDRNPDVIDRMMELYDSQILAFYDPLTHTYFAIRQLPESVAGVTEVKSLRDSVVIHELTHALQDQRFDAAARDRALLHDADGELAYHSLLEGEASLVMLEHLIDKSGHSFEEAVKSDMIAGAMSAGAVADRIAGPKVPRYFVESLKFPYIEGLALVIEGYRRGGWKEIDRMEANPPRTTREVLHPVEYFARLNRGERGAPPFDPPAAANVLTTERLGEFHWRFLVGAAAEGWIDDRVTVGCDGLVVAETRWENSQKAAAFREAYVSFLRRRGIEPRVSSDGDAVKVVYAP